MTLLRPVGERNRLITHLLPLSSSALNEEGERVW